MFHYFHIGMTSCYTDCLERSGSLSSGHSAGHCGWISRGFTSALVLRALLWPLPSLLPLTICPSVPHIYTWLVSLRGFEWESLLFPSSALSSVYNSPEDTLWSEGFAHVDHQLVNKCVFCFFICDAEMEPQVLPILSMCPNTRTQQMSGDSPLRSSVQ